jgi:hypothetical protein
MSRVDPHGVQIGSTLNVTKALGKRLITTTTSLLVVGLWSFLQLNYRHTVLNPFMNAQRFWVPIHSDPLKMRNSLVKFISGWSWSSPGGFIIYKRIFLRENLATPNLSNWRPHSLFEASSTWVRTKPKDLVVKSLRHFLQLLPINASYAFSPVLHLGIQLVLYVGKRPRKATFHILSLQDGIGAIWLVELVRIIFVAQNGILLMSQIKHLLLLSFGHLSMGNFRRLDVELIELLFPCLLIGLLFFGKNLFRVFWNHCCEEPPISLIRSANAIRIGIVAKIDFFYCPILSISKGLLN